MRLEKMYLPLAATLLFILPMGSAQAQDNASGHSFGVTPEISTKILLTDSLSNNLSPEAKRIIGRPMLPIPNYYTNRDTTFSASLFAPIAFDLSNLSSIKFPKEKIQKEIEIQSPLRKESISEKMAQYETDRLANNKVSKVIAFATIANKARESVMVTNPRLVRRSSDQFPDRVKLEQIDVQYTGELAQRNAPEIPVKKAPSLGETIDRKYWIQAFQGSLHLSQSSVSKNWHKGGYNSLNFNSRVYYNLTYKKDKINWVNELEYKMGLFANNVDYTDKKVGLKISEDIFRINSNYGIKAYERWFYTLDAQLRSQLMKNKDNEGNLTTLTFAPIHLSAGLGMKYELDLKNMNGDPFQKLKFTANVAPISASIVYTYSDLIDKGRIGLEENENFRFRLGSTIHLNLDWDINDRLNWRSRMYYNTSFKHVEVEFENALTFTFNRFFSTRLAVDLRYDDSVIIDEPKTFKNLLQYNQLFSLGFEYKF